LLVDDGGEDGCSKRTTDSTGIGVGHDAADVGDIANGAHGQLGGTVKAIPTHPEDEHAQDGERHVGTRNSARRAIRIVLAATGAEDDGTGQSCPAANRVNDGGTSKVDEA